MVVTGNSSNDPQSDGVRNSVGVCGHVRRYACRIVMVGALIHLISYPVLSGQRVCDLIAVTSIGTMVVGGALLAKSRRVVVLLVVLGTLGMLTAAARFVDPVEIGAAAETTGRAINLVFSTMLAGLTIKSLIEPGEITTDQYAGAVTGYLLIALAFADTYLLIEFLQPASFNVPNGESFAFGSASYVSLVTLTTLGYGDVVPISPTARIAAALEAVLGVLYLALLVSRLVAQFGTRSNGHEINSRLQSQTQHQPPDSEEQP